MSKVHLQGQRDMSIPCDTSEDTSLRQRELLRSMPPAQRVALALQLSANVIRLAKQALGRLHPSWTVHEISQRFVELHYGHELSDGMAQRHRTNHDDPALRID
ncbi:MAG TPA: hypothetical protein VIY86_08130 [Pirellulaceae bacterium]